MNEEFDKFANKHRQHQKEAIEKASGCSKGQICIPTGTGKTRIQTHLHVSDAIQKTIQKTIGVYVIVAHRLILCKQLLDDLISQMAKCSLPFDIIFVGSSRVDESDIYERYMKYGLNKETTFITYTTCQEKVRDAVKLAQENNRHCIIASTYHSFDHLRLLDNIDVATFDEAHTIVSSKQTDDNFEAHVKEIQKLNIIRKQYFFTATRKVSGLEYGMNDKDIYGEVIYEKSPREMVEAGEIVPPRIHRVKTEDDGEFNNYTMVHKTIKESFLWHKEDIQNRPTSKDLGSKLLVGVEGTPIIEETKDDNSFIRWCFKEEIELFLFSSKLGYYTFDNDRIFNKVSRNQALDLMRALKDNQDAIIIHIDILTEGIDLPSITGVLPFRNLNLIKLLQTIGRGGRLLLEDREKLYSGEIKPMEWDKMIKPYCDVIIPKLSNKEKNEMMEEIIRKVYESYEIPEQEYSLDGVSWGARFNFRANY
jgi:superfamily II DNA or RNA helicase